MLQFEIIHEATIHSYILRIVNQKSLILTMCPDFFNHEDSGGDMLHAFFSLSLGHEETLHRHCTHCVYEGNKTSDALLVL
jgi:hypothetical protein